MTDIKPGSNTQAQFFSPKNEMMLERLLQNDFQRRTSGDMSDRQRERLKKTVKHYMTEVYSKHAGEPMQYLNKEVLTAVVPDFMSYLRRNSATPIDEDTGDVQLRMDVNARFSQLQVERQEGRAVIPAAPDFRIPLEEGGPTPLSKFEEIKRQREIEIQRDAETAKVAATTGIFQQERGMDADLSIVPMKTSSSSENPLNRFIDSDVDFKNANEQARQREQLSLIMREAERAMGRENARNEILNNPKPEIPDPRKFMFGDAAYTPLGPRGQGIANGNQTLALPDIVRSKPVLPQDVLKAQDDIMSYKETEHNLFVYSADRDWVNNNTENRYNFSVMFDPANNRPGFGYSPATNIKFKNITRIEFVKAIMPVEACDVLPAYTGATPSYSTDLNPNIFNLPYLQVRIPELNTNGYGTSDGMNNAFAAISYDAYWTSDTSAKNKGFARMIPKFLKCQKVFSPTPLATLTKLTFEIQRPDGELVCNSKDTLDITGVYMPVNTDTTTNYKGSGAATYEWIWLKTSAHFNKFLVSQGDRIQIKNVAVNSTLSTNPNVDALVTFLTRPEGHLVSDIGQLTGAINGYTDGANSVGYANGIIIRNDFSDPTTGLTIVKPWVSAINSVSPTLRDNPTLATGRLINLNKQIQIILRVITRDMDSAAKLRPDNLQA
jgi:hypothetical protein